MWTLAEAVRGLADGCLELGIPVTGGNVSFYNSTADTAILPTPVVGVLGVIDDVAERTPMAWSAQGQVVCLVGSTREDFAGSEWAHAEHGHLGGQPPQADLAAERALAEVVLAAPIAAAHDVADGGVAQALAEMAMRSGIGARIHVPTGMDPATFLWSETPARAVVVVDAESAPGLEASCAAAGVTLTMIGTVGGDALQFDGLFDLSVAQLRDASESTFPRYFGPALTV